MLYILLLIVLPGTVAQTCRSSPIESWCTCTDLPNGLLQLVCKGNGLPSAEKLPKNTEKLYVTENKLKDLEAKFLKKAMPQLKVLDLSDNDIENINISAFVHKDFRSLEVLILDNNKLVLSEKGKLITGLNSLKTLSLKNAFYNGTYATLVGTALRNSHTESLESVILDDNDFSGGLLPTTFNFSLNGKESKAFIKSISLRNTSLELLFPGTLNETHLPSLNFVDLSENKLETIDKDVINDLDSFLNLTINFTGNPFICNCRLYDFVTWVNKTKFVNVANYKSYTCSNDSPKKNVGRKLFELDPASDLKGLCYDIEVDDGKDALYPSYIALSIVFVIVAILALVILFLRRGEIYGFFHRMFNVAHETLSDKSGGGYSDMDNPYIPETPAVDV